MKIKAFTIIEMVAAMLIAGTVTSLAAGAWVSVSRYHQRLEEKNLYFKIISEAPPLIKADPFQLEQMIINIIDNAIKYTDEGGITTTLEKKNGWLVIGIEDTGCGIPKNHLHRIFERFYVIDKSRSRKFGGTGLGLSIVKHIVLLHKGRIDVESAAGEGTKFTITLPAGST